MTRKVYKKLSPSLKELSLINYLILFLPVCHLVQTELRQDIPRYFYRSLGVWAAQNDDGRSTSNVIARCQFQGLWVVAAGSAEDKGREGEVDSGGSIRCNDPRAVINARNVRPIAVSDDAFLERCENQHQTQYQIRQNETSFADRMRKGLQQCGLTSQ